jgi:hypothetical protein
MSLLIDNLSNLNQRLLYLTDEDGKKEFFCDNLVDKFPIDLFGRDVGLVVYIISITYILSSLIVIAFINQQAKKAQLAVVEESRIASNVIFPVFVNILWINAAVMFYIGMITIILPFGVYSYEKTWYGYFFAGMYAIEHCVIEGVAFLLMNKGLGYKSARKCVKRMIIWFVVTFICKTISFEEVDFNPVLSYVSNLVWEIIIATFYLVLWKCPHKHLFRRPAAIFYSKFWFWFRTSSIICNFFHFYRYYNDIGQCFELFLNIWLFAILEPVIIYYTLLEDAYWWQGLLSSKNSNPEDELNTIKSPLAGIDVGLKSAQVLAASMDSMSSGTEVDVVRLLNFSYIVLDTKFQLGTGSFSKVYRGSYKNQECAIKLIFTVDLTIDVIERIAAEAQILSSFKHPNIVSIIGVSVLPPSVCILLELCAFGSLADVVKGSNIFQDNRK